MPESRGREGWHRLRAYSGVRTEATMRLAAVSALLALVLGRPIAAENWPQWRGPLGTGVSPENGLPSRWGPDTLAWTARLAGAGVSSPVVWGDRVFVTSQTGLTPLKPGRHPRLAQ